MSVFTAEQLRALALMFLNLTAPATNISLVFFGFYCLLVGFLVFRSSFLPRFLGVLMAIAGLAWLTNSFANFLAPSLAGHLAPYIMACGGIGEGLLCLWLMVMGVNAQRWNQRASAAGS